MQNQTNAASPLPTLTEPARPSVTDQVFDTLQSHILSLALPPGIKISEAEVAGQIGVSRQPVRDAFYRLSKLGFLTIRPQRATTVSLISEAAVLRARFIRTALESETCRALCQTRTQADIDALAVMTDAQATAIAKNDAATFHKLDDAFHKDICLRAGHGYAWDLIHDSKAHMDRVRMLSLNTESQTVAHAEHLALIEAITAQDGDAAVDLIRSHLSRIKTLISTLKSENHDWFTLDEG